MTDLTVSASTQDAADVAPKRRRRRYRPGEVGLAALFLLPSALVFGIFFYLPFFKLVSWGRFESTRGGGYRDVGMAQYREVLFGEPFKDGLIHSITFVLYTVPAGLVLGILLAVAAHRQLKGIKVFQAIFSSTLASSVAVSSVMFLFILNPVVGLFKVDWINERGWSLFAAALPSIWQNLGLAFVIVLAGLQAVPEEVMEAARLDGYGSFRRLVRITLPLISPVLLFLTVVLVVFGFQAFAQIDIITGGGPAGSSETLVFKIFRENQNYGAGAVLSVGLFVVTFVVTALQFAILDRRVHYDN
ncbi:MAG: sugar ABC transporter permease [Acidimicrobiales bacterium]|nr:sugar ABC transporter permease [Acidimicrobiales bacterium]